MSQGTRRVLSFLALAVSAGLLFVADGTRYLDRNLIDSSAFADKALATLESEPVRRELARELVRELEAQYPGVSGVAPEIEAAAEAAIGSSLFRRVFRAGVRDVHRAAFDGEASRLALDLRNVGVPLLKSAQEIDPRLTAFIPRGFDARVVEVSDEVDRTLADLKEFSRELGGLADLTLIGGLLGIALSLICAVDRRGALVRVGLVLVGLGVLYVIGYYVARGVITSDVSDVIGDDAAHGAFDAVLGGLRTQNIVIAALGLLLAVGATIAGRRREADPDGW